MKNWMRWKTRSGTALGSNPWNKVLGDLRKRKGNAPKLVPGYQVWQRDHKDEIAAEAGENAHISKHNSVAARLFKQQDEDVRKRALEQARREHAAASAAHRAASAGSPSNNPAEQLR